MIVLFTDFGWNGPYVGQVKARILERTVRLPIIDLLHDAPCYDVRRASYLLASYASAFPQGTLFVAVVDPGVGSTSREPVLVEADGKRFLGPGNGLFDQLITQSQHYQQWRLVWRPSQLSATFHGRDLFAPVAAMLAEGTPITTVAEPMTWQSQGWPEDLNEVIYIDPYGNAVSGMRACQYPQAMKLAIDDVVLERHHTFADVPAGAPFFYENANGLLEIAINQGRAASQLHLTIGSRITLL
ncbi:MAG TPA: SAM-dependent chlorinase/fluorinase [Gammaproteobacteria bacterium]